MVDFLELVRHNDGSGLLLLQIPPYKDNQHGGRLAGADKGTQGGGGAFLD